MHVAYAQGRYALERHIQLCIFFKLKGGYVLQRHIQVCMFFNLQGRYVLRRRVPVYMFFNLKGMVCMFFNLKAGMFFNATYRYAYSLISKAGIFHNATYRYLLFDGRHQRVDIPSHARTAQNGLLQNRLEDNLCLIAVMSPGRPDRSRDWTELNRYACILSSRAGMF